MTQFVLALQLLFLLSSALAVDKKSFVKMLLENDCLDSPNKFCHEAGSNPCGDECKFVEDGRYQKGYYCDCRGVTSMRDCREFYDEGYTNSGVYFINMNGLKCVQVFCDQDTAPGGWTVIQRRTDGSVQFYRNWADYQKGFGDVRNEFWFGNENIYLLTLQATLVGSSLRVDLNHPNYQNHWYEYSLFEVGSEATKYTLSVSSLVNGTHTEAKYDGLAYHNGSPFSTYDADNDHNSNSCAKTFKSGWWFNECHKSNLNGVYEADGVSNTDNQNLIWMFDTFGKRTSFLFTEMKVRRN